MEDTLLKTISELTTDFQALNEHQISFNLYLETSQNIYNVFCQQMRNVVNGCVRSRNTLENILCELDIAYETKRFDFINSFEIRNDTKKLLKHLEETGQQNEIIKNDIEKIIKLISDEKQIENGKFFNKMCRVVDRTMPDNLSQLVPICFFVVSNLTFHHNDYTLPKIAVDVLFTGVLANTIIYCKVHEAEMLSELTSKLIRHMSWLEQHSKDFGLFVSTVIKELINSINSAEKNIAYNSLTGVRVEKLTSFMYHTNAVFKEIDQVLLGLASTTCSELLTLKDCMKDIQVECMKCDKVVKDMKEALFYAEETQSFARIDVVVMKEVCQTLLNIFQVLANTNERVHSQGDLFDSSLSKTIERFEFSRKLYKWKYRVAGAIVGSVFTGSVLGTLVGVCATHLGTYCTSYSKSRTDIILKKVHADAQKITDTADSSLDTMGGIVNRLQDQFELACKNNRTRTETGVRVKKQVDEMIYKIYLLQKELDLMKKIAKSNERYIKKIMRLENVVDLLNL
ncbi:hypothetical protein INT48_005873 [Thamnidium elegans]|uniref:Uncharacterized protein n=1 Tax=Thamnidium elegans TaxID=101142 RepID=A0A8H7SM65_9FUNG|nr:hypothetical protein INT48_005873 [Thamnidium elegans]